MKKRAAMILAFLMALMILLPLVLGGVSALAVSSKDVDNLKDKASNLASEKKEIEKELKELEAEQKDIVAQKAALDKQIDVIGREIENSEELITLLGIKIAEKEEELRLAIEDEAIQKARFMKRVRSMEEGGETTYIAILLSSDGFADMLGRVGMINDILEYDKKIMADLRRATETVESAKAGLEEDKSAEEDAYAVLEERKGELVEQHKKAEDLIGLLEAEHAEYEKAYEEAKAAEKELQKQIVEMLAEIARQNASKYVGGEYTWPLPGYYNISSKFGMRFHPTLRVNKLHTGVDLPAPKGTKIIAANTGKVITAGYNAGYGNYVVIDHGGGQATLYAHMSKILVSNGQSVKQGENIGLVGTTGYSTGNHLHFEIIIDGVQKDPMKWFKEVN